MSSNTPFLLLLLAATTLAPAGSYPDAAGLAGSTAIPKDSPLFVNWANGHAAYQPGSGVDPTWQAPPKAYGRATDSVYDILCLGNGGSATLFFPLPIRDGPGADFAVFENGISDYFLELAFVEVSSDGIHFTRFPTTSLTTTPVGGFGELEPSDLDGFAGKYRIGFGTPFDLATLPDSPALDKQHIRFVRLVDIIGDGTTKDSANRPIYDPTPTIGSGGFDLEAIGVLHQNPDPVRILQSGLTPQGFLLAWESNPGSTYQIVESTDLTTWQPVASLTGAPDAAVTRRSLPTADAPAKYWRIARVDSQSP